jgi:hypothetical protein
LFLSATQQPFSLNTNLYKQVCAAVTVTIDRSSASEETSATELLYSDTIGSSGRCIVRYPVALEQQPPSDRIVPLSTPLISDYLAFPCTHREATLGATNKPHSLVPQSSIRRTGKPQRALLHNDVCYRLHHCCCDGHRSLVLVSLVLYKHSKNHMIFGTEVRRFSCFFAKRNCQMADSSARLNVPLWTCLSLVLTSLAFFDSPVLFLFLVLTSLAFFSSPVFFLSLVLTSIYRVGLFFILRIIIFIFHFCDKFITATLFQRMYSYY